MKVTKKDFINKLIATRTERKISTGFDELDVYLFGFVKKRLYLIASNPGMGKTTLLLNLLQKMAFMSVKSLFFSLEMDAYNIETKIFSNLCNIPLVQFNYGEVDENDINKCNFEELDIYLINKQLDIYQIIDLIRKYVDKFKIEVIAIDFIALISQIKGDFRPMRDKVGTYISLLHKIGEELNLIIIVISQLNREFEKRKKIDKDFIPCLSDLKESSSLAELSDVVIILSEHFDEQQKRVLNDVINLNIIKNRYGRLGIVPLYFNKQYCRFEPLIVSTSINNSPDSGHCIDSKNNKESNRSKDDFNHDDDLKDEGLPF